MAVIKKKPILVDQVIIDGLTRLKEKEAARSVVGAAPSIQELARKVLRRGLADYIQ
ncbi:hypothetical protein [Brenneria corticis]|uniref:hypothetical protein n=1 Tax=Brenneria corticis TaxID=2173106 RepID=UPI00143D8EBE|nr:hypothetical protein [Brenneria sp. CFCC 11842]